MNLEKIWSNRSEEDIHKCLEEGFRNLGYDAYNIHRSQRRNENGIDIEFIKGREKTVSQIKLSPKKRDIKQLKQFSKRKANKLIYVYVKDPTVDFRKEMKLHKNIEFWDAKKLHKFLFENQSKTYLKLIFLSLESVQNIIESIAILHSRRNVKSHKIESEDWKLIWRWGDKVKKLHFAFQFLNLFYSEIIKERINLDLLEKDLKNLKGYLEFLKYETYEWYSIMKMISENSPYILSLAWKKLSLRTGWDALEVCIKDLNDLNKVKKEISDWFVEDFNNEESWYNNTINHLDNFEDKMQLMTLVVDWIRDDNLGSIPSIE